MVNIATNLKRNGRFLPKVFVASPTCSSNRLINAPAPPFRMSSRYSLQRNELGVRQYFRNAFDGSGGVEKDETSLSDDATLGHTVPKSM